MDQTKNPEITQTKDLTYNDYLCIPSLLDLQKPQSDPTHHDELLFIVIHQSYELWFKLILHEIEAAMERIRQGRVLNAHHFTKRCVEILRALVPQIHILETMAPIDFLEFREKISPASGFQSLQFREVEFLMGLKDEVYFRFFQNRPDYLAVLKKRFDGPCLRTDFLKLIEKTADGKSTEDFLREIYTHPSKDLPLYLLCESLVELDEYMMLWREHHVRVVERIIGFKIGTGGSSGVDYLKSTTSKKSFPELWAVRGQLVKRI